MRPRTSLFPGTHNWCNKLSKCDESRAGCCCIGPLLFPPLGSQERELPHHLRAACIAVNKSVIKLALFFVLHDMLFTPISLICLSCSYSGCIFSSIHNYVYILFRPAAYRVRVTPVFLTLFCGTIRISSDLAWWIVFGGACTPKTFWVQKNYRIWRRGRWRPPRG